MYELFKNADPVSAYPLLLCSVIALAVFVERTIALFQLTKLESKAYLSLQASLSQSGNSFPNEEGIEAAPVSRVIDAVKPLRGHDTETLRYAAEIALSAQRQRLRKNLNFLATIASTAPFIGLFGTVLGVMSGLSSPDSEQQKVAIGQALSATAIGLMVAVPSVILYNLFLARVQNMMLEIQAHVAHLIPLVNRPLKSNTSVREEVMPGMGLR